MIFKRLINSPHFSAHVRNVNSASEFVEKKARGGEAKTELRHGGDAPRPSTSPVLVITGFFFLFSSSFFFLSSSSGEF